MKEVKFPSTLFESRLANPSSSFTGVGLCFVNKFVRRVWSFIHRLFRPAVAIFVN